MSEQKFLYFYTLSQATATILPTSRKRKTPGEWPPGG